MHTNELKLASHCVKNLSAKRLQQLQPNNARFSTLGSWVSTVGDIGDVTSPAASKSSWSELNASSFTSNKPQTSVTASSYCCLCQYCHKAVVNNHGMSFGSINLGAIGEIWWEKSSELAKWHEYHESLIWCTLYTCDFIILPIDTDRCHVFFKIFAQDIGRAFLYEPVSPCARACHASGPVCTNSLIFTHLHYILNRIQDFPRAEVSPQDSQGHFQQLEL